MQQFGEKLKKIRRALGLNQAEMAKELEVSDRTLRDYEKNKFTVNYDFLGRLIARYNVNSEWIFKDEGRMFSDEESNLPEVKSKKEQILEECSEDFYHVPYLKLKPAAGGRITVYDENAAIEAVVKFKKYWIKNLLFCSPKDLTVMNVDGDSMEPTFSDGDLVLVDKSQNQAKSGIFVIRIEDTLVVKRVHRLPDYKIEVISDNSIYKPYILDLKNDHENEIVGKVLWSGGLIR